MTSPGQAKMFWDYLQNTISTDQYYTKYNSLFTASDFLNPLMMTNEIADNNNSVDVEFVMLPYGYQRDSTVKVDRFGDKELLQGTQEPVQAGCEQGHRICGVRGETFAD